VSVRHFTTSNPAPVGGSFTGTRECWCCGVIHPIRERESDPWDGRLNGYCDDCALARCDTSYSDCGKQVR
jgi:hypothetical protein